MGDGSGGSRDVYHLKYGYLYYVSGEGRELAA